MDESRRHTRLNCVALLMALLSAVQAQTTASEPLRHSAGAAITRSLGAPLFEEQTLFKSGEGGYHCYRIPAMVVTTRGTVLAFCEARKHNCNDHGDVDLVMRRSIDGGRTWGKTRVIADDGAHTMGNPCPVVDQKTGTIWLPFCRDNKRVLVMKSIDDGQVWSAPTDITKDAMNPSWHWVGTGPGHGIQLASGRLLIPCWADATPNLGETQFSYVFFSDDAGKSWKLGGALDRDASDECEAIELADGSIYLNMRSRQGKKRRAYATSRDGGRTWCTVRYDDRLPEPSCQGSIIRLGAPDQPGGRCVLSTPANPDARTHLTLRLSCDECRSWPVARVVHKGASAYCDLAVTKDQEILLLYEADEYAKLTLARLNLQWLTEDAYRQSSTSPANLPEANREPRRSPSIRYMAAHIPKVTLPGYGGQRYEASVPDTLDLQERAALAIHGLTNTTDPESDYEIYWAAQLNRNPVFMWHSWNDACWSKYVDSLPLLRLASGSRLNQAVERRWLEVVLHMQGPDGLFYYPKVGKSWWPDQCYGPHPPGEHYTIVYADGRLLDAIALYYRLTRDRLWKDAGKRAVDGLEELAIHEGDRASFDWVQYGPGRQSNKAGRASVTHNFASWFACTLQGLANYYRATGYEPAKTLGGKLARWILSRSGHFDAEGCFLPEHSGTTMAHFHGHTMVLLALLDYALAAEDAKTLAFVRKSFEFARRHGNTTVGYFSEWLSGGTAETCEVADMVALALKLSQAGEGDYWDDADRWIRNQFAEAQLLDTHWVDEEVKQLPVTPAVGPHETTERVPQRIVGCFASQAAANDWVGRPPECTQACCNGNGARTLYYVWENILTCRDGKLRINLLLNRASPWADVDSYIPYQGRVDIRIKTAVDLFLRIPEWVQTNQARCMVNGSGTALSWRGRYAAVGKVRPGDLVTLHFPIFERTEVMNIEGKSYTLIRKGNDVVHINPPGRHRPLYQREDYRDNKVHTKKITRFVADQQIDW